MSKAKGKRSPPPTIHETEDGMETVDYGIYKEAAFTLPLAMESGLLTDAIKLARAKQRGQRATAIERLIWLQSNIRDRIRQYVVLDDAIIPSPWITRVADIGDGPQGYVFAADRVAGVEQAVDILTTLDAFLASDPNEREALIFLTGLSCGRLLEMLDVLPHESDTRRGKVVANAATAGGKARAKLTPSQRQQAKEERDRLIWTGYTKQDASRQVAAKYSVSYRTIERL